MSEKTERKAARHHKPLHGTLPFVRAGGQLINLAHVVTVILPTEDKPLTVSLASGTFLTLTGEDADAVMAGLGDCCDVSS